ncbi:MAG TPA: hypothetical protein VI299_09315 [Polyangiales bacterium]
MRALSMGWLQGLLAVAIAFAALGCGASGPPRIVAKSMPQGGTFTGVWHSPQYGEMHMRQNGSAVLGRYTKDERNGRIQGSVQGDLMRFEWTEKRELIAGRAVTTKGHGYFRILHDEAEGTWKLLGEWGHDASERGGGPWNAIKSPKAKVMLDSQGHATDGSDDESSDADSDEEDANDFSGRDTSGGELDNL